MLSPLLAARLKGRLESASRAVEVEGLTPLRGEAIVAGDYPKAWTEFVGQERAVSHLRAAVAASHHQGTRLEHVLLASGLAGVGKTSLARLIAHTMGVGYIELSGPVGLDDARSALRNMTDGDVLFYDEIHQAVAGGKAKAEWLLHLLQDGSLLTAAGREPMPDITVVAATTDAGRLPQTILGRFPIRPVLAPYTTVESREILGSLAVRMGFGTETVPMPEGAVLDELNEASNGAPRQMKALLTALRHTLFAGEKGFDVGLALDWAGVAFDGLDQLAQDYLGVLVLCNGQASLATIAGMLGEPGPMQHVENTLISKGLVTVEPSGRRLTKAGMARARQLQP